MHNESDAMSGSCCTAQPKFDGMSEGFKRALWIVIAINAAMFAIEMSAGAISGSQALKADALDFLGDTITYSISLFVIGRSVRMRTSAALFKGLGLAAMGLWVLGSTLWSLIVLGQPNASVMGVVGVLALLANLASVGVLMRYRNGDSNVRSVWVCSRNDAISNLAVILAAALVAVTGAAWPDLLVAALMAALFLWSAAQITSQALQEMRQDRANLISSTGLSL